MEILFHVFNESFRITLFVLIMMVAVDYINVKTKGRLELILKSGKKWKQYIVASLLGAAPGCLGSFAGVSLYIHGMISFGALTGLMISTAGDEQFIMLAMFPKTALIMFAILFLLGIIAGYLTDYLIQKFNIKTCTDCEFKQYHPEKKGYKHYFKDHIWSHIIKGHLIKVFLWTFGALLIIEYAMSFVDLKNITAEYTIWILLLSALIGIIPESGPHLIFVMLFAKGLIPFSVLFTSSIVQDGHGMLPMLSYSVKDSLLIKTFNLFFGLTIGLIIYLLGY
ncbi:MAG: putative manganese transporter [Melioribacter sp.]|uniref:putative manganese transporter n=1 Tax=Rosettibacter primus TaxID=3111523 RepID=UPI00247D3C52|nr:putative manganese transporter [Melioribacter sp.]